MKLSKRLLIQVLFFCISNYAFSQSKYNAAVIHASPCVNEDFELSTAGTYTGIANVAAISGWSVSSHSVIPCPAVPTWTAGSPEFSVVQTPILTVPQIGILPNSPLGGTKVAWLNNNINNRCATRLTHTVPVTASNTNFNLAFAAVFEEGNHGCCDNAMGYILFRDGMGNIIPCISHTLWAGTCGPPATSYSTNSSYRWTNWQQKSLNLSPYIGQNLTLEVIVKDCAYGEHRGFLLFDAQCGGPPLPCSCGAPDNSTRVNYCAGSSQALIQAPPGSQYLWQGPVPISPSQATLSVLTITNPAVNNVYTVAFTSTAGCLVMQTYTLVYTSVAAGTSSTVQACIPGSTGAATVFPTGSGAGYNYSWIGPSSSSVISTGSTISNAGPGSYVVNISASAGCGSVSVLVNIPATTLSVNVIASNFSLCSGAQFTPFLSFNTSSPNYSFQISPATFTSPAPPPSYFVITPTISAGISATLVYTIVMSSTVLGCTTNNTFAVTVSNPLQPTMQPIPTLCSNDPTLQLLATPPGGNFTSLTGSGLSASGLLTPSLAAFVNTFAYTNTLPGCSASLASSYTVQAAPQLTLTGSTQLCSGHSSTLSVNGANTYSWSNGITTSVNIVSPMASQVYTVTGYGNGTCSSSQQVSITVLSLPTIILTGLDTVCGGSAATVTAGGGQQFLWTGGGTGSSNLFVQPFVNPYSVAVTNTLTGCSASKTFSLFAEPNPTLWYTGSDTVCNGQLLKFTAGGAGSYLWSNGSTGSTLTYSATGSGSVFVVGTGPGGCKDTLDIVYYLSDCVNLIDLRQESLIKLYPIPCDNKLTIVVQRECAYTISTARGQNLLRGNLVRGKNEINMEMVPAGTFLIELRGIVFSWHGKIVKLQ